MIPFPRVHRLIRVEANMKLILISIAAMTLLEPAAQPQTRYKVIDLGTLPDSGFSQAFYVNNSGITGGQSVSASDGMQHAVLWLRGMKGPTDIGPAGVNSGVFGINERGQSE